ncbi:MAG: hypothetical protein K2P84_14490 [Undibacterium sp.]|nr:hypothetical protein [Undibacterium sp.]
MSNVRPDPVLSDPVLSYDRMKTERDEKIKEAHRRYGYRLAEIGRYLDLHYSTVSRIVSGDR